MSQSDKKEIAKARFITGETIAAIADAIGVSRRTIERWADEGNWRNLRSAATEQVPNVVTLAGRSHSDKRSRSVERTHPPIRPRIPKGDLDKGDLDKIEITENAIHQLSAALAGDTPAQSIGGIAASLVRLMEYHDKKQPDSAAEVAAMAIELGISPVEFAREMREQWQQRQA